MARPGKIISPTLPAEVGIACRTLCTEYSAHCQRVGLVLPGIVQPVSLSPIDPVASSTNITFSGWAVPPALAALAVEVSVKEERPNVSRRKVETVAVWVTETTLGLVPLQLGRLVVAVTHRSVGVELVIVTCATGFAVFQLEIAAPTVVALALVASSA